MISTGTQVYDTIIFITMLLYKFDQVALVFVLFPELRGMRVDRGKMDGLREEQ